MKIIFFILLCITQSYAGENANNDPYFDAPLFSRIMCKISQGRDVSAEDKRYLLSAPFTIPYCVNKPLATMKNTFLDISRSPFENERLRKETLHKLGFKPRAADYFSKVEKDHPFAHEERRKLDDATILWIKHIERNRKREESLSESSSSPFRKEAEHAPSVPSQPIVVPPLPDTIKVNYEHKNACFETFKCESDPKLPIIRDTIKEFVEQNLDDGPSRIVYLWGPAGSGKTHCLVASMRYLSAQGKSIESLKADQIHNAKNKRVGYRATLENFIEVLGPNIFIDDLNSTNTLIMQFLKILVLSAFDEGGKKIMITSNMNPDEFVLNLTKEGRFYENNTSYDVYSKEADRLLRRFGAMATIINFEGVPCMHHNWLDERYEGNVKDDLNNWLDERRSEGNIEEDLNNWLDGIHEGNVD